jgi:hypothetical protein
VFVHAADCSDGRISRLEVKLGALPRRTIDRDTAIAWMRDMHSFIPVVNGEELSALQLVEVSNGDAFDHYIRTDNAAEASDTVPALPGLS